MKGSFAFLFVFAAAASAVILEPKPFKRQIPADRLRGAKSILYLEYFLLTFYVGAYYST